MADNSRCFGADRDLNGPRPLSQQVSTTTLKRLEVKMSAHSAAARKALVSNVRVFTSRAAAESYSAVGSSSSSS